MSGDKSLGSGKVALVTGSSRGIGRAIAKRFASAGIKVVINYRADTEAAEATVAEIRDSGGEAFPFQADISDADRVEAMFQATMDQYGQLDFLVCNAAYGRYGELMEIPEKAMNKAFDVNVIGTFRCARAALPLMRQNGGGRVVVLGSPGAHRVVPGYVAVGTSKGALESMVRYLAAEFAPHNISVNAVSPGMCETDAVSFYFSPKHVDYLISRTPMGRMVEPDEVAGAVAYLCEPRSAMICGQVITIDGGLLLSL